VRGALERFARRFWAGELGRAGSILVLALTPLAWLWGAGGALRNRRWVRSGGTRVPGLCIVSVGNLAVGGTGKTPLAGWVARFYADRGHRVSVLTRGYGGDEPLLHRRWSADVPVIVDPDRVRGARAAVEEGRDVAVLDDGFQHRRLARTVDLVVLAAEQGYPGRVLPVEPFREGVGALARATAVAVSRRTATVDEARQLGDAIARRFPHLVVAGFRLVRGRWVDLAGTPRADPSGSLLAVAGVGRPETFFATVCAVAPSADVESLPLADHRAYDRRDAERLALRAAGRTLVVTEKDAVKLACHADVLGDVAVLSQAVEWEWGCERIEELLLDAVHDPQGPSGGAA